MCDGRSEEHTSELQSLRHLVCRLLLEKKIRISMREAASVDTRGGEGCAEVECARLALTCSGNRSKPTERNLPLGRCSFCLFFKGAGPPRVLPPFPTRPPSR